MLLEDIISVKSGEQKKTHSQVCAQKNKQTVGTDRINRAAEKEIEKLKAAQAPRVGPQQLVKPSHRLCHACMWVQRIQQVSKRWGKTILGTNRPLRYLRA